MLLMLSCITLLCLGVFMLCYVSYVMLYCTSLYSSMVSVSILYHTILYVVVLYSTLLDDIAVYGTLLYYIMLY